MHPGADSLYELLVVPTDTLCNVSSLLLTAKLSNDLSGRDMQGVVEFRVLK